MADPTWDTTKENFQPLRRGRDPRMMEEAADMKQSERAAKIQDERRCARARRGRRSPRTKSWSVTHRVLTRETDLLVPSIRPPSRSEFWNAIAKYEGDDPLSVWVR